MNKNLILVLVLVVLVVVSVVQAFQLTGLKSKLDSSGLKVGSASTPQITASSGSSVPSSLQDLPSMVGGC